MPEVTKKPHIDDGKVLLTLRVHRNNASRIREYARAIEMEEERNYSIDEVFPECMGGDGAATMSAFMGSRKGAKIITWRLYTLVIPLGSGHANTLLFMAIWPYSTLKTWLYCHF